MIAIISPAKALDFKSKPITDKYSQPVFLDEARRLNRQLKKLKASDLSELMGISQKLAELNVDRNLLWEPPFTLANAKQAALAFNGDVYQGLQAETFSDDDFETAQNQIRILSGLYGLLRPLDLIQAYRLEMGTKLEFSKYNNLYEFWQTKLTKAVNDELEVSGGPLINLASNEYAKVINLKKVKTEVITPSFKDHKNGKYQMISFFAKKARGLMCRFMVQHKISNAEELKAFDLEGYYFNNDLSQGNSWVFTRDKQP